VGDDVLVHLATVLRTRVREEDAVLSRLGGHGLAILMPGCRRDVAALRAENLLQAARSSPMTLADGTFLALSISIGVAHLPQHSSDRRGLYTAADASTPPPITRSTTPSAPVGAASPSPRPERRGVLRTAQGFR
jgi:diguanylate cyclase (GGDEF)-like protein